MIKLCFVGAGSFIFARQLAIDLFTFGDLPEIELALMDIDAGRLETTGLLVRRLLQQHPRKVKLTLTTQLGEALDGAKFVVAMYEPHGLEARKREMAAAIAHGVPTAVGDTLGPSGIFKGVRTATVALEIAREMEKLCPDALFMNYVNPLSINCWAVSAGTRIKTVGMCHGLEYTKKFLSGLLGLDYEGMEAWGAGINHMLWIKELRHNGRDLYPELWRRLPELRAEDPVRFGMMEATGLFMTESPYHSAEYIPYFRSRFRSIEVHPKEDPRLNRAQGKWTGHLLQPSTERGGQVEPCVPLMWDIQLYEKVHAQTYEKQKAQLLADTSPVELKLSMEYAIRIVHSIVTGTARTMNLNVPNRGGLIPNLPEGAVVELAVRADKVGLTPFAQPALEEPCASLCRRVIEVQSQAVAGILEQDARKVFNAVLLDPLTGACLEPTAIRGLFRSLCEVDRGLLPEWMHRTW